MIAPDDLDDAIDDASDVIDEVGDDVCTPMPLALVGARACPHSTRATATAATCSQCLCASVTRVTSAPATSTSRLLRVFAGRGEDREPAPRRDREVDRRRRDDDAPGRVLPGHERSVAEFICRAVEAGDLRSTP